MHAIFQKKGKKWAKHVTKGAKYLKIWALEGHKVCNVLKGFFWVVGTFGKMYDIL